ncbi:MAG: hypothetical protein Q9227_007800 [Pyrenula ochraceoflavens]
MLSNILLALLTASELGDALTWGGISALVRSVQISRSPALQSAVNIPFNYSYGLPRMKVALGKNRDTYYSGLDLGSGKTWVGVWQGEQYDMSGHNMHGKINDFNVHYTSGQQYSGDVWQDGVTIEGHALDGSSTQISQDLQFGIVRVSDSDSSMMPGPPSSWSVFGLSYTPASGQKQNSQREFLESYFNQHQHNSHEIGFYFPPSACGDGAQGQVTFGGRDSSKYTGDVTTVPVMKQGGGWVHMLDGIAAPSNGKQIVLSEEFRSAMVDSGQEGLSAQSVPAILWHQLIPGAQIHTIRKVGASDESRLTGLPATTDLMHYNNGSLIGGQTLDQIDMISFALPCNISQSSVPRLIFNGRGLDIAVEELVQTGAEAKPNLPLPPEMCGSRLQGFKDTPNWGLGQYWMRSFYTILNWGDETRGQEVGKGTTVSYARAKHPRQCQHYNPGQR